MDLHDALIGGLVACLYVALLAISWFKGYWEPRTAEPLLEVDEELLKEGEEEHGHPQ
jgi:hypothetical protein